MTRAIAALAAVLLAASGPRFDLALPAYVPRALVSGTLRCAGGDTMEPLTRSWAAAFTQRQPAAHVDVDGMAKLSADGFGALLDGHVGCVTYVREPFPAERTAFVQRFGREPLLVPVGGGSFDVKGGTHAIAIYVNVANPLDHLDLTQLDAILSAARKRGGTEAIVRWGQLGLGGAWAGRPVHVYSMVRGRDTGNPPGIVNYMQHRVLLGASLRDDVREQRDAPGEPALDAIVDRVAADEDGIGYSGFAYAKPGTKTLALAEMPGAPYVRGTAETVAQRTYPLARTIYLLFAEASPLVREFVRFVISRDGQQLVAEDAHHFLPLTAEQAAAARSLPAIR